GAVRAAAPPSLQPGGRRREALAADGEEDLRLLAAVSGQLAQPPVDLLTRGRGPPDRAGVAAIVLDDVRAQLVGALAHRPGVAVHRRLVAEDRLDLVRAQRRDRLGVQSATHPLLHP